MKTSPVQRSVLEALKLPGAYLSYAYGHQWRLLNVPKKVHGVNVDWMVAESTMECLKRAGLIIFDKRECFSRNAVGYFLAVESISLKEVAA